VGRLKTLGGLVPTASTAIAIVPPKTADSYYHSAEWQGLRSACLVRDGFRCQLALPGCTGRATIADHVISRRAGGRDELANLRAVCRACDNRVKEDHLGRRRGG
jgi:5-methylcytosine-specific restriction endonuclease McrA